jgi:hypothetical protein
MFQFTSKSFVIANKGNTTSVHLKETSKPAYILFCDTSPRFNEHLKTVMQASMQLKSDVIFGVVYVSTNTALIKHMRSTNTPVNHIPYQIFYVQGKPVAMGSVNDQMSIVNFVRTAVSKLASGQKERVNPALIPHSTSHNKKVSSGGFALPHNGIKDYRQDPGYQRACNVQLRDDLPEEWVNLRPYNKPYKNQSQIDNDGEYHEIA